MIITIDKLPSIRAANLDKKVVLTSGTFDLFHVGHLEYLNAVKSYGDIVVVMLSGDRRVKDRKGDSRPVIAEGDRARILDALVIVDYVFVDPGVNTSDSIDLVYEQIAAALQPDVYVTDGEDVRLSGIIDSAKYVVLPRSSQLISTTAIIESILHSAKLEES